jgi:Acyl-CoA dehydrogenase, N-terminal domain
MIDRTLFSTDHEAFRDSYHKFCEREIAPFHEAWEEQGYVGREVWRKAGANGFLCMTMPEAYGGAGEIMKEVIARSMGLGRQRAVSRSRKIVFSNAIPARRPKKSLRVSPKAARKVPIGLSPPRSRRGACVDRPYAQTGTGTG